MSLDRDMKWLTRQYRAGRHRDRNGNLTIEFSDRVWQVRKQLRDQENHIQIIRSVLDDFIALPPSQRGN